MFESRNDRSYSSRLLSIVSALDESPLSPYSAVMFGIHHADLSDTFRDEQHELKTFSAAELINLFIEFSENNNQTWLDANSYGLSCQHYTSPSFTPTIVLVRNVITDLSLFWNKNSESSHDRPSWILPVPADQVENQEVLESIRRWLVSFCDIANYCVVTSESIEKEECILFAETLKQLLSGSGIDFVDYEFPRNRLPITIPYESQITWPIRIEGRKVELVPPAPKRFDLSSREYWYIDLLNELGSRRALLEMSLPVSETVEEILNGPCPPHRVYTAIKRFSVGVDSINMRCNSDKDVIHYYVPSEKEVIEELLLDGGYESVHDEKRASYLPTIERFGGLYRAASAFGDKSGQILNTFRDGIKLPSKVRGLCKLGKGEIPIDDYLANIENPPLQDSSRMKRVSIRRFKEFAQGEIPERLTLNALLEHWADKSILKRNWKLGPCSHCGQTWFSEVLVIQNPILCENCGGRVLLPESIQIGYSLEPAVKHALEQGIITVVLAGRFLRNLTSKGFFWLPGVKYQYGNLHGDIDIVACCDGQLVFAECKTLLQTSDSSLVWRDVVDQFVELAAVAINCKASLIVLASQVESYPTNVKEEIKIHIGNKVPYLLLNKSDLQKGRRDHEGERLMSINSFRKKVFPERHSERAGGKRTIHFGPSRRIQK